jgi:acyl carrier protein
MTPIETRIRGFIDTSFPPASPDIQYPATQSLLETGVIDSMGVLSLVMWLEQEFDITVDDDEVLPENLDSIASIRAFVECKLADRDAGDASLQPAA